MGNDWNLGGFHGDGRSKVVVWSVSSSIRGQSVAADGNLVHHKRLASPVRDDRHSVLAAMPSVKVHLRPKGRRNLPHQDHTLLDVYGQ